MKFGRKILQDVEGYVPGEQRNFPDIIKLNTNENPYPPSPKVAEAIAAYSEDAMRKYPDPQSVALRKSWADRFDYDDESWVIAGNGMDEILALTLRTFLDPGQVVLTPNPTYTLYEILTQLHDVELRHIDLDSEYQFTEAFYNTPGALCFIPRPNAPSGINVSRESMERLCSSFEGLVFIDEAYADFAEDSCIDFPKRFDNVIVGRSFSKSYSLAGMRLGMGTASPELITEFMKTKDSYNLNGITQVAGLAALLDRPYFDMTIARVKETRARLIQGLRELGFIVPDSQANFVLARWDGAPSARTLFEQLRDRDLLVRYFDVPGIDDALRVSVGTDEDTDTLLVALAELISD